MAESFSFKLLWASSPDQEHTADQLWQVRKREENQAHTEARGSAPVRSVQAGAQTRRRRDGWLPAAVYPKADKQTDDSTGPLTTPQARARTQGATMRHAIGRKVLLSMLPMTACSGGDHVVDVADPPAAIDPAPAGSLQAPRDPEYVSVQTSPAAVCTLHPAGVDDPAQRLEVYADDRGVVDLEVRALSTSDRAATVLFDCQSDGHPLAPQSLEFGTVSGRLTARADGVDLPLGARDRTRGAGGSAGLVAKHPRLVDTSRYSFGPVQLIGENQSSNWSGSVLAQPGETYWRVAGNWTVPSLTALPGAIQVCSMWVGLGGFSSTNSVLQVGTMQIALNLGFFQVSTYDAWIQAYPNPAHIVPNLSVHAGDQIRAGMAAFGFDPPITLINYATDEIVQTWFPEPASYEGDTAEWILEKPIAGVELADFGITSIGTASATGNDSQGNTTFNSVFTAPSRRLQMYNGPDLLSLSLPVPDPNDPTAATIYFVWVAPQ
jgi:hypothetical protein